MCNVQEHPVSSNSTLHSTDFICSQWSELKNPGFSISRFYVNIEYTSKCRLQKENILYSQCENASVRSLCYRTRLPNSDGRER
jgi:hypothetical protein